MASPTEFAKRLRKRAKTLDNVASEAAKAGVRQMLQTMVEVTPVDTSQAVSNWRVGISSPPSGELQAHSVGSRGSTRGVSSGEAIDRGNSKLEAKKPGETIYLSNTARHIGDLDRGKSPQFAGGFIPRAQIVFRIAVKDALKRLWR